MHLPIWGAPFRHERVHASRALTVGFWGPGRNGAWRIRQHELREASRPALPTVEAHPTVDIVGGPGRLVNARFCNVRFWNFSSRCGTCGVAPDPGWSCVINRRREETVKSSRDGLPGNVRPAPTSREDSPEPIFVRLVKEDRRRQPRRTGLTLIRQLAGLSSRSTEASLRDSECPTRHGGRRSSRLQNSAL